MRCPPFAALSAPLAPLAELGDGEQTPFVPVRNCQMLEGSNLQEVQTRIQAVRVFVPRKYLALSVWLGKRQPLAWLAIYLHNHSGTTIGRRYLSYPSSPGR